MENDKPDSPSEFHLAVCQMVYKYMQATAGDVNRLVTLAKAQVVCGESIRSIITRGQLLDKRPVMDDWTQAELLEVIAAADKADERKGPAE